MIFTVKLEGSRRHFADGYVGKKESHSSKCATFISSKNKVSQAFVFSLEIEKGLAGFMQPLQLQTGNGRGPAFNCSLLQLKYSRSPIPSPTSSLT